MHRLECCLSTLGLALLSQADFSTEEAGVWQVSWLVDLWDFPSDNRTRFNILSNDSVSPRDVLLQVLLHRHDAHRFP
jgi:hypothetical protein